MAVQTIQKKRGRPQDKSLDRQITRAAWRLLADNPLSTLTINEIAICAGTSRPAIYRRWNSVEEIVIDAFLEVVENKVPLPSTPHSPDALREYIVSLARLLRGRIGRVIAEILGRAQNDPQLMKRFHNGFLIRRRNHARELIERGQLEGHFRTDIDCELIIDMYAGPIYFRAFARHALLDDDFAQKLAELVISTISVKVTSRAPCTDEKS